MPILLQNISILVDYGLSFKKMYGLWGYGPMGVITGSQAHIKNICQGQELKCVDAKAGQKNIVVYCNPTDPWPKAPTQKIFQHFWGKIVARSFFWELEQKEPFLKAIHP